MNASQIRVRPRPNDDPPADEAPAFDVRGVAEPSETRAEPGGLAVNVRRPDTEDLGGRFDVPLLAMAMGSSLVLMLTLTVATPIPLGLAFATFLGCSFHLLMGRHVFIVARRLSLEHKRLRAAMTCPYCRDHLPDDRAMVCDRDGCGSFYHDECWAECRATYGGCAIYGCGCGSAHGVGRFALQRRVIRLLLAAALFPPKMVKRLRESETQSFSEVLRRSREYQNELSHDTSRTLGVGAMNLAFSFSILGIVLKLTADELSMMGEDGLLLLGLMFGFTLIFPVIFMRLPLAGHFAWFFSRAVASVFRAELAALSRADQGTFLARLVAGAGKKA